MSRSIDGPELKLMIPYSEDDTYSVSINWRLSESDASWWKRPISITISPYERYGMSAEEKKKFSENFWETIIDLSRDEARVMGEFILSLIKNEDLRQDDDGKWI